MVQDMLNPEFFVSCFRQAAPTPNAVAAAARHGGPAAAAAAAAGAWQPVHYCDHAPPGLETATDTKIAERRPFVIAAVPGESAWAAARWRGQPAEPRTPAAAAAAAADAAAAQAAGVFQQQQQQQLAAPALARDKRAREASMAPSRELSAGGGDPLDADATMTTMATSGGGGAMPSEKRGRPGSGGGGLAGGVLGGGDAGAGGGNDQAAPAGREQPGDALMRGMFGEHQAGEGEEGGGAAGAAPPARLLAVVPPPSRAPTPDDPSGAGDNTGDVVGAARRAAGDQAPPPLWHRGDVLVYVYDPEGGSSGGGGEGGEGGGSGAATVAAINAAPMRLHDVVDVIGVLSIAPGLAAAYFSPQQQGQGQQQGGGDATMMALDDGHPPHPHPQEDELAAAEMLGARPPTSAVPRVHALLIAPACPRMTTLPVHPALRAAHPTEGLPGKAALPALKAKAVDLLRFALGGDALAAEYALLVSLSRVFARSDGGQPHGMLSLNLTGCPPCGGGAAGAASSPASSSSPPAASAANAVNANPSASPAAEALHTALAALLPHAALLPVTLPELNAGHWAPRKDHASGRLARGRMQLAAGTVAVLDEGGLAAGRLAETGVASLRAIEQVLREQQLPCDFEFYTGAFAVDLPLVVVGEGRSLLKQAIELELPVRPDPQAVRAAMAALGLGGGGGGAGAAASGSRAATPALHYNHPSAGGGSPEAAAQAAGAGGSPESQQQPQQQQPADPAAAAAAAAPSSPPSPFPPRDAVRLAALATPQLDAVRDYLAAARSADCVLPASVADDLAGRFVEMHRADPRAFGPLEFSRRITLAKLLALSEGEAELAPSAWDRAGALEAERAARVVKASAPLPANAAAGAAGGGRPPAGGPRLPPRPPSGGGVKRGA
jgi:hypothetical protein